MAKQEKEIEKWVTVNGARVPIFKDGSIGGPKALRDKVKASEEAKNKAAKSKAFKQAAADYKAHKEGKKPIPSSYDDMTSQEREEWRKKTEEAARKAGATSDSNFKTKKGRESGQKTYKDKENKTKQKEADEAYTDYINKMEYQYERAFSMGVKPDYTVQKRLIPQMSTKKLEDEYIKSGGEIKKAIGEELEKRKSQSSKQSKQIDKDFDTKEKQIAKNKAEKEKLEGKTSKEDKVLAGLKFSKSGDTRDDMGNMEKLMDVMDNMSVGNVIGSSDKYGSSGYKKIGPNKWVYQASGLLGEGGGIGKQYDTDEVMDKIATSISNGHTYTIKRK